MKKLARVYLIIFSGILFSIPFSISYAGIIFSPESAIAGSTYGNDPHFGIENVIDQSGLYSTFVSGVTDFDSYIASNPLHNYLAPDKEWFGGKKGIVVAGGRVYYPKDTVTFNLGNTYEMDKFALWNEENGGVRAAKIFASLNGVDFSEILNINPTGNQFQNNGSGEDHGFDYSAEVFLFSGVVTAKYLRFDMTCPNGNSIYAGCSMGEIAFSQYGSSVVSAPEPSTLAIFVLSMVIFGWRRAI